MADPNFIVKNGLTVNTNFSVNSTSMSYSGNSTFSGTNTVFSSNNTFNGNITIAAGKGIRANGSFGSQGQALISNGSSVYCATATAGSNTQIQFNDSATANASAGFVFNKTTNNVTIGNTLIVAIANVSGTANIGGNINVTGNSTITGSANIGGNINVTGNANVAGSYRANSISIAAGGSTIRTSVFGGGESVFVANSTTSNIHYMNICDASGNNGNTLNFVLRGLSNSGATQATLTLVTIDTTTLGVTGDVVSAYSDDRLKNRLENIPNALEKIKALNGFYYTPNKTAVNLGIENNQLSKIGVSAQECQKIIPEVVKEAPIGQGYLTVQYEKIVPLLIEAIKELEAKVNSSCSCSCGGK